MPRNIYLVVLLSRSADEKMYGTRLSPSTVEVICEPTPKELESPPVAMGKDEQRQAAISAEDLGDLKSAIESLTDKTGKTEEEEVETLKKELQGRYSTGLCFNSNICTQK